MNEIVMVCIYLTLINVVAFIAMLLDKTYAQSKKRRIPEVHLLSLAAAGGSIGAITGMVACHHKISKPAFYIGIPIFILVHWVVIIVAAVTLVS